MSEMEHHKGELLLITFEKNGLSFKEKLGILEASYDMEGFDPTSTWSSIDLVWFKGNFYSIERENIDPSDDIMTATIVNSEVIKFETRFYNGGAHFSECIEQALNKL